MEKEETRTEERKYLHVTYFCDGCGKELDSVNEYADGYVPASAYEYEVAIIVPRVHDRYTKKCIYCNDCAACFESALVRYLENSNFRKGW